MINENNKKRKRDTHELQNDINELKEKYMVLEKFTNNIQNNIKEYIDTKIKTGRRKSIINRSRVNSNAQEISNISQNGKDNNNQVPIENRIVQESNTQIYNNENMDRKETNKSIKNSYAKLKNDDEYISMELKREHKEKLNELDTIREVDRTPKREDMNLNENNLVKEDISVINENIKIDTVIKTKSNDAENVNNNHKENEKESLNKDVNINENINKEINTIDNVIKEDDKKNIEDNNEIADDIESRKNIPLHIKQSTNMNLNISEQQNNLKEDSENNKEEKNEIINKEEVSELDNKIYNNELDQSYQESSIHHSQLESQVQHIEQCIMESNEEKIKTILSDLQIEFHTNAETMEIKFTNTLNE